MVDTQDFHQTYNLMSQNTGEDAEENKKEETDSEDASPATVQQTDASSSVSKSLLALARLPKVSERVSVGSYRKYLYQICKLLWALKFCK